MKEKFKEELSDEDSDGKMDIRDEFI